MKELIISALFLLAGNLVFSQKMITRTGEVRFEASMPAFEEVAATNKTASCILEKSTGDFVALTLIKSFKFKAPLMEEHFNENYMESSQFPKATFKGKILNFDAKNLSASKTAYDLEGDLTIHGVTKKIKTKISAISVKPQDYKIEIPGLVKGKIAENVKIEMNFILETN
jgi:polyisoprenoid-binding protein YceI